MKSLMVNMFALMLFLYGTAQAQTVTGSKTGEMPGEPSLSIQNLESDAALIRTDLELGYRDFATDGFFEAYDHGSGLNIHRVIVNGYFDIELDGEVTSYISLGVGATFTDDGNDATTLTIGEQGETRGLNNIAPAGQVGVGAAYNITDGIDLIGGYNLLATPNEDAGEDETILLHGFQFGVNFQF